MNPFSDAKIVDSWIKNASPWTTAVRAKQIESRKLITDRAIVQAVLSRAPSSVLDLGCGEGWLARELAAQGIDTIGIDVVPELIKQAQSAGRGDFRIMTYEEVAAGRLDVCVDVAVCNFALLGKASVDGVFKTVPALLKPHGSFIIQTLHPHFSCGDTPYQDGWRQGSWSGFSADFTDPAPWYFRTLETWLKLFADSGFRLLEIREPIHPNTQKPASVIFLAKLSAGY